MKKIFFPNMLLIAGTGRNSGKTTLACNIISKIAIQQVVIAIKVSPHFHDSIPDMMTIIQTPELYIAEEINEDSGKDSARMLKAGASRSFFVMCKDEQLDQAVGHLLKIIPKDAAIVCESGGLRRMIEPGLFLMMNKKDNSEFKKGVLELKELADRWITFDEIQIDFDYTKINFKDNKWILNEHS